ncbi:NACHT, LRR and PYD domains-containing protein 3-like [Pseudorasbora parva]|uniref:NACHT, LRR and PYD domains-containing protein 3-like n=1 Tax=Pseudorasbora parva TaxID=51549 RepID=UPI00351E9727
MSLIISDTSSCNSVSGSNGLIERSDSSGLSVLSMKSDRSMKIPIQLKNGSVLMGKSLQQEKSDLSAPSVLSLKSDRSMKIPIQLKNGSAPTGKRDLHIQSGQDAEKNGNIPGRCMGYQHNSETLELKIPRFKSHTKKKHLYILEGFAKQGNPTLLNEIYTELYITEGGNGEISNEHEIKRIEKSLKAAEGATIPIKCSDIFRPLPGQDKPIRTVLTKGVAGIGKTVSVQKFILDWAEEKENQDVQLIFPLPFRELNLMKDKTLSLSGLLHDFFPETNEMEISSDKYKVLFILDGLDECRLSLDFQSDVRLCDVSESASVDVLLTNLIAGNLLPSALIWITSRPAAADLVPSECVHRVTEVRGFNEPQKEEYFRKRIRDQSLANRIISHLKSSRSLYIMCHIPVFCWISATVLEKMLSEAESGEIPKTLTQMYTHFLMAQISVKNTKYTEKEDKEKEMTFKLGKLAYEQLERGNVIFYGEDLRECGIDVTEASVYSGLCTQIFREEFGWYQGKVFCFVHLSVQEHLAALYVHLSFTYNNINVLEAHESETPATMFNLHKCAIKKSLEIMNGRLDLFLRFLVGLSLESNHNLLKGFLVKRTGSSLEREKTIEYLKQTIKTIPCSEMNLVFFHCLNELNDHSLITEIQSYLTSEKINSDTLSPHLWSALVFILMTSNEKFNDFELCKYGRSDAAVFWLLPVIKLSKKIWMHDCNITEKGCAVLSAVLPSISNLRELDLSYNNLQDSGVEILCVGLKRSGYSVEKLVRSLGSEDCDPDLSFVVLPTAGLQDSKCRLESLNLNNCGVTEAGCVSLSSALSLNPSHLKVLDLSWNNIGDSGVKHLCAALERVQCALEILKLLTCKINAEGFESLASTLKSNTQLRELDLGNNSPGDQGVELLSAVLHHPNCRLKTLRLDKCGMTEKSCTALASALSSETSSLTHLDLSINDLQDSGVKKLCVGLHNPHCKLEKLGLSNCNVTHEGVVSLTEALKSNPSHLKEIRLLEKDLEESDLNVLSMILEKTS